MKRRRKQLVVLDGRRWLVDVPEDDALYHLNCRAEYLRSRSLKFEISLNGSARYILSAAGCTYLISTVYPFAKNNDTTETLQAIVEDERLRTGGPLLFARNGAAPIADDPFGNIYFMAPDENMVYFYDYEQDTAFCTRIPVKDFLDSLYSKEV